MKRSSITSRVTALIGFGIVIALLISLGSYTIYQKAKHSKIIQSIYEEHLPANLKVDDLEDQVAEIGLTLHNIIKPNVNKEKKLKDLSASIESIDAIIDSIQNHLVMHPEERQYAVQVDTFKSLFSSFERLYRGMSLVEFDHSNTDFKELRELTVKMDYTLPAIKKKAGELITKEYIKVDVINHNSDQGILIISAIAIILAIITGFRTSNIIRTKERKLTEEQNKVKQLFDHSSLPLYISDYDGNVVMTNEMGVKHLGYSRKELYQMKVWDLDVGYITLEECRTFWDQLSPGNQIVIEGQHRTKSGEIKDVELNFAKITEDDEKLVMVFAKDITDQKKYRQEIKEKEERLELALNSSSSGLWDWNLITNEIVVDENWAKLIGYELKELLPTTLETWSDKTHPEDLQKSEKSLKDHLSGRTTEYQQRIRMNHKNGDWVWIWVKGKVTEYDDSGKPIRMTGTHTDINDLVVFEQALEDSEEKYKFLSESLPHILWVLDEKFNTTYVNNEVRRQLGKESFSVYDWPGLVHPKDFEEITPELNEATKNGKDYEFTIRLKTVDESYRWFKVVGKPIVGENGRAKNWVGMGFDLHDEKEKERLIAESESRFRALVNSFNDLIFIIDPNLRLNAFYGREINKLEPDTRNMIGKKPTEILPPEYGEQMEQNIQKAFESGTSEFDWDASQVFGHPMHYRVTYSAILDADQNPSAVLGVARDVTTRKKYETKLYQEKEKQAFLAEKGRILVSLKTKDEIFDYVGEVLENIIPDQSIYMIDDYTVEHGRFHLVKAGGNTPFIQMVSQEMQVDLNNFSGVVDEEFAKKLIQGKFIDLPISTDSILGVDFPTGIPESITQTLQHFKIRSIGIIESDKLFGNLSFIIPNDKEINEDLIASFVQLISTVIEKMNVLENLEKSKSQLTTEKEKLAKIADVASELANKNSVADVNKYLTEELALTVGPDGYVVLSSFMDGNTKFRMDYRAGSEESNALFEKAFGVDFDHYEIDYPSSILQKLTPNQFNPATPEELDEMGLVIQDESLIPALSEFEILSLPQFVNSALVGKFTFIKPKEQVIDEDYIFTILNHSASVLDKIHALEELIMSEKRLEDSRNMYQELVDTAPVVLYEFDFEDGGLNFYGQTQDILGYSTEELIANPWLWNQSIHPEDLAYCERNIQGFKQGKGFDIQYRVKDKDGNWKWLRDISINHNNKDRFIRGIAFDITKEKNLSIQINEQLKAMQEQGVKLELAIDSAEQGIFEWDLENDIAYVNENYLNLIGYKHTVIENFSDVIKDLIGESNAEVFQNNINLVASGQTNFIKQISRIKTENGIKWIKGAAIVTEVNDQNQPSKLMGTIIDITDIKQKEEELSVINSQLSLIIESIPGVIFNCKNDDDYSMNYISEYIEHISGYEAEDFLHKRKVTFASIIHPDDYQMVRRTVNDSHDENKRYNVTYRIITKSGEIRWLSEVGEYKKQEGNEVIDGIIFDITDNIAAEENRLSTILKSTDQERVRLAREIHDNIQQTMVSAYYNFESLRKEIDRLSERQKQRLDIGLSSLNQSIDDTRTLAHRLMPKQIEDFGLSESLEQLVENLNTSDTIFNFYCNKKERYESDIEINLYRITQEALNNIQKYAKANEVFVQLTRLDDYLTLTIEDDGIGFNPDKPEIIYTGLGIQSMKSRAQSIGARFEITTSPGKGTYISIEAPIKKAIKTTSI